MVPSPWGKLNQEDLPHSSPFAHAEAALAWLFFGVTELRKFKVSVRVYSESLALIRKGWWEGVQRRRLGRQRFTLGSKGRWGMTNIWEPKTAGIPSNPQEIEVGGGRIYSSSMFATLFSPMCLAKGEKTWKYKTGGVYLLKKPNSLSKRSTDLHPDLAYWRIWCGNYHLIFPAFAINNPAYFSEANLHIYSLISSLCWLLFTCWRPTEAMLNAQRGPKNRKPSL